MRKVIIVQARMSSTRLPGKVLKTVLNKPLLEYLVERLRRVERVDEVVIATTTKEADGAIVDLCKKLSVACFRGSEEDVLARYYEAAKDQEADAVVRVTSDCPVIDPCVIDKVVQFYSDHEGEVDYVSNSVARSYPRGMDTEIFSFQVLEKAFNEAILPQDREHVTPFIYRQPDRFRLAGVSYHEDLSDHRWTVDTPEDFELIRRIIEELYPMNPTFSFEDILMLFQKIPALFLINAHVQQKKNEASVCGFGEREIMQEFKTEREKFWAGEFGDQYVSRNQGAGVIASNTALFAKILACTDAVQTVIEFGANLGLNLIAIRHLLPQVRFSAIEINGKAVEELKRLGDIEVHHKSILDFSPNKTCDFALIKGVLIHMAPACLPQVYDLLYKSSHRYLCVAEYYNPTPVEVTYRGHQGKLFKRDFAGELLDRFGDLELIDYGFVYHRDPGFPQDDITWFLLEKKRKNF